MWSLRLVCIGLTSVACSTPTPAPSSAVADAADAGDVADSGEDAAKEIATAATDVADTVAQQPGGSALTPQQQAQYEKLARAAQFFPCWNEDKPAKMMEKIVSGTASHWSELAAAQNLDCLATDTNGCQAWTNCTGIAADPGGPCKPSCAGDVSSVCYKNKAGTPMQYTVDCTKVGWTCTTEGKGFCAPPAGAKTCLAGMSGVYCDGSTWSVCHDELQPPLVEPKEDCAKLGMSCGEYALPFGSSIGCIGTGPACDSETFADACVGAKLKVCKGAKEMLIDCEKVLPGSSCQIFNGKARCRLAAECDSSWEACEGSVARFCMFGKLMKFDCKALGFTGCHPEYGVCTPVWLFQ